MVAELIHSLNEKARPAPNWTNTSGVYGDYSDYPDIKFYTKCPKCGAVHGDYKSLRDAHRKRLCGACDLDAINKMKEMIKNVDAPENRGKPAKGLSKVFNEADEMLPAPPEDEGDEEFDPREYVIGTEHYEGWIEAAVQDLSKQVGQTIRLSDSTLEDSGTDLEHPDSIFKIEVVGTGEDYGRDHEFLYTIWRTEDEAITYATNQVEQDIEDSPENFNKDFIKGYINTERLARDLRDQARDIEWLPEDTRELVDELVRNDCLREEDFYTPTGRFKKITPRLDRMIDQGKEMLADKREAAFDPMEWLEEVYGKEEATKQAIEIAGVDAGAAARACVAADGWDHYVSSYDSSHYDLEGGAVAVRTH